MKVRRIALFGLLALLGIANALGQSLINLDEIVVSDNKLELPKASKTKRIVRIEKEQLVQFAAQPLPYIISQLSGIEINGSRGNPGQNLGIYARGGGNRQILVLIDGIPVNDPSQPASDYDLRLLDVTSIAQIEIIKGPSSVVYGSGAATAVISITTIKESKEGLAVTLSGSAGTNRSQDEPNKLHLFQNTLSLRSRSSFITLGHFTANGMSALSIGEEADAFNRKNLAFGKNYELKGLKLDGQLRFNEFNAGFDDSFLGQDADFLSLSKQLNLQLNVTAPVGAKQTLKALFLSNQSDREIRSNYPAVYSGGQSSLDLYYSSYKNDRLSLLGGVYLTRQTTEFSEAEQSQSIEPYFNGTLKAADRLHLNAGVRYVAHSSFGSHWVYQAGPSLNLKLNRDKHFRVFAAVGSAFIAPSLSQLFGRFGPNPDLEPETNSSIELGLELLKSTAYEISLTGFSRTENNRVIYALTDPDTWTYQYLNSAQSFTASGLEFAALRSINKGQLALSYTFTEVSEKGVLRLPKHKLNLNLSAALSERFKAHANLHYISSRLDTDFSTYETLTLDSYSLVDMGIQYTPSVSPHQFGLNLSNLFNTRFTEIIGFPTRGQNLSLSYQLRF